MPSRRRWIRWTSLAFAAAAVAAIVAPGGSWLSGETLRVHPSADLLAIGMKFDGAGSCTGSKCHGGESDAAPPADRKSAIDNSHTIWTAHDRHAGAFETLAKPESAEIAGKLGIADATASAECLNCHALDVPASQQGQKFSVREGVTCNACHGPSEKWNEPHATEGWTQQQRLAAGSHGGLLRAWGLYDTKPATERASMCVTCHLGIDSALLAAGHPQPVFELLSYQDAQPKHWVDEEGYATVRLWAAGQIACLEQAMRQLAARAGDAAVDAAYVRAAADQAMAHLFCVQAIAGAGLVSPDLGPIAAAGRAIEAALPDLRVGRATVAGAAQAAASAAAGMRPAFGAVNADRAATLRVLAALSGDAELAVRHGRRAAEQQAFALFYLHSVAYAVAESLPEDQVKAVDDLLAPLYDQLPFDDVDAAIDAAKFAADVRAVAARLPRP